MHTILMLIAAALIVATLGRDREFDAGYVASIDGRHQAAIAHYTNAIRSGALSRENRARALNNRAVAFQRSGQSVRALADLDEAIVLLPDDLTIARNRAAARRAAASLATAHADAGRTDLELHDRIRILGIL